jgi:hypothetical protein
MSASNYFKVLWKDHYTRCEDVFPFDGAQPAEQQQALVLASGLAIHHDGRIAMWKPPIFGGHASIPIIGETA